MPDSPSPDELIFQILLDPAVIPDPHPLYRQLRETAPLFKTEVTQTWIVSGFDNCRALLRDPRCGSPLEEDAIASRIAVDGSTRRARDPESQPMLFMNPPDHTRVRGLVSRAFTPRRVEQLRPEVVAMTDGLLDALRGEGDFVNGLAFPLPANVISALVGVPAETRQAMRDSTTGFERILPGANRMYPDTDTPPMPIPDAWVQAVRVDRPERGFEREARYRARGLDSGAARRLSRAAWSGLFDRLQIDDHAVSIESTLQHSLPGHLRRGKKLPDANRLQPWANAIIEGWLLPEATRPALERILGEPGVASADVLARYRTPLDPDHLEGLAASLVDEAGSLHSTDEEARLRWAMGRTRGKWLGHYRATVVRDRMRKMLNKTEVRR